MIRGATRPIAGIGTGMLAGWIPGQPAFPGSPASAPADMRAVAKPGC